MGKNSKENISKYSVIIKSFIIGVLVTALFIFVFAFIMYLTEAGFEYAAVFGTAAVAAGTFASAFFAAKKKQSKGLLTGFVTGIISFLIVTVISLIVDKGGITVNTLFHFIIIMLSALIGGIFGVNKGQNKKYI